MNSEVIVVFFSPFTIENSWKNIWLPQQAEKEKDVLGAMHPWRVAYQNIFASVVKVFML